MRDYHEDITAVLSHQTDNDYILWATSDLKLFKGSPFTTLESPLYLLDLKLPLTDPIYSKVADLIFSCWREDGRFKTTPNGGVYPCKVALALKTLCYLGYAKDERLQKTLSYFLTTQEKDGGWKCSKYSFGRGKETEYSTPITTLFVLDCMRFFEFREKESITNKAIEFLLEHWVIKKPISPCHYGIGTLFMQVEYPFRGYNLFYYLYVLSFYKTATSDSRFLEAYQILNDKIVDHQVVIERVVPKLSKLSAYQKGKTSPLATEKYNEIQKNISNNR